MPICGFNQKMLGGLVAFSEGLVEHGLEFRSEQNGETIEQGIKREISDMARLIPELNRIDNSSKRIMTEGIVKYAMGFYMNMRRNDVDNYKEVVRKLTDYFESMDSKYYGELEGKSDDMEQLIKFLNEKQI